MQSAYNNFHEQNQFHKDKSMYKFHKEKNEHPIIFTKNSQPEASTDKNNGNFLAHKFIFKGKIMKKP